MFENLRGESLWRDFTFVLKEKCKFDKEKQSHFIIS
jgi:hypothetical protein